MFSRIIPFGAAFTAIGLFGVVAGCSSQDGSFSDTAEGEVDTANASLASGGPQNLKAFVGGNNIALTWDAYSEFNVKHYRIFRDGIEIGRSWPRLRHAQAAAGFTDPDVKRGQTYQYQVQAMSDTGLSSPMSGSVTATHPTQGFPVPTITIDDSQAPETRPLLDRGARALKTWYPKIADLIAAPAYTPSASLTIRIVKVDNCVSAGWTAGGNTLNICDYMYEADDNEGDMGLFVHEATHIMQNYHSGAPRAVDEGIASWAGDLSQGITRNPPLDKLSYLNGYEYAASFYRWIQENYNPNFIRNMNVRAHYGEFKYDWYRLETGKEVSELWQAMTGVSLSKPFSLFTGQGLCAVSTSMYGGFPVALQPCSSEDQAKSTAFEPYRTRLHMDAHCLEVTSEKNVIQGDCNAPTDAQRWGHTSLGQWKSLKNFECLQPEGGALVAGKKLVTAPCDSNSPAQKWTAPGVGL
jgi:hypothetical protein